MVYLREKDRPLRPVKNRRTASQIRFSTCSLPVCFPLPRFTLKLLTKNVKTTVDNKCIVLLAKSHLLIKDETIRRGHKH